MTDKLELLPCPFCGAQPLAVIDDDDGSITIECISRACPATIVCVKDDDATAGADRWNTRAP